MHDVDKSTLVFDFQQLFCVPSLSLAEKTRVFKCHGLTVVQPRKIFLCLCKILGIVCTKKIMHFDLSFCFFLNDSHRLCDFRYNFFHFFLHKILEQKFYLRKKNLLLECLQKTLKKLRQNCFENVVSELQKECLIWLLIYFEKKYF